MAKQNDPETSCGSCDALLDEPTDLPIEERPPCGTCGSSKRLFRIEIRSSIAATGSVEARLTNEPGKPVVVRPKTVRMTVTAPSPTISTVGSAETVPLEDLPTEVISEAIEAGITLLPPDPDDVDGQWVAEVDTGGYHVPLGVGQLPDILLVAAEWLEGLAERVQERRKDEGA